MCSQQVLALGWQLCHGCPLILVKPELSADEVTPLVITVLLTQELGKRLLNELVVGPKHFQKYVYPFTKDFRCLHLEAVKCIVPHVHFTEFLCGCT